MTDTVAGRVTAVIGNQIKISTEWFTLGRATQVDPSLVGHKVTLTVDAQDRVIAIHDRGL